MQFALSLWNERQQGQYQMQPHGGVESKTCKKICFDEVDLKMWII